MRPVAAQHRLGTMTHQHPTGRFIGELDLHLIGEGRHEKLWEVLGAHVHPEGTHFAVWAPNALDVSVIGDFNGWDRRLNPMTNLGGGVWEAFLPGIGEGPAYKFSLRTTNGEILEKADPLAQRAEPAPATASIVTGKSTYRWSDDSWLERRATSDFLHEPMSIYEVHLGSWHKGLSYREMATELVNYVTKKGFTHVELMGISEHPYEPSWGYQVTSYYAPNHRPGGPDDLRMLIDELHRAGVGVIMDWVPGHFPKDSWALGRFDGTALYEHPDPRRGNQPDWGTYVFNFGRHEVRNFLVANALYWCDQFHIDGLRVDAVASMLYLDYSRREGEWEPNIHGGREHLEAVAFLQEMNAAVQRTFPGVLTIAEESTSWPGVTAPTNEGGLGFSLKWNMGWMHDSLEYIKRDPIHRSHHHGEITFSMVYAYSENYVLPISHDEVVHGKGTLWSRMPGQSAWDKAAMTRTFLAYMWSHPGKKLLFQGQEFGQVAEWNEGRGVDWSQLEGWEGEYHRGIASLVTRLNELYVGGSIGDSAERPAAATALADDHDPEGFAWIANDDSHNNVLSHVRRTGDCQMVCVTNFSGQAYYDYRIGVPATGRWREVLNTDAAEFEGADLAAQSESVDLLTEQVPSHGYDHSATLTIPAHSARWFALEQ